VGPVQRLLVQISSVPSEVGPAARTRGLCLPLDSRLMPGVS